SELKPQRGVSLETGFYHRAVLIPGSLNGEISLSIYQMDMEDELDVNLQTFQYGNIASSRHRGIEMGLQLERPNLALFRINYTLQNVTYRAGEHKGNFVKAIPRDYVSAAISVPVLDRLQAMATVRSTRRTWLDDKNSIRLENFSSVDFKVTYTLNWIALEFETMNLLNNSFSTTGFISGEEGSETTFMYPAAGRAMQAGIRVQW
ncbi:MAG: TonB-dependent receptor, partial [Bacteroidetes bacterium]|nr:TonB-dependent receptor [Bacteroidota bacterium]